ncbi:hypothetical protein [Shigella dysenteriae]|nr:hypothetical protein [Shigella dysenteriae]WNT51236.1 hypothetical protein PWP84_01960 [Shigella dysenteriae]
MNVNAGHERTSKARIIHQIQLIRGITKRIISKNENDHSHQVIGQETEMTSKLEIRHKQRRDEIIGDASN